MARLLGYKEMPVDIETFVNHPYYLGNTFAEGRLFPAWLDELKDLFPDPIRVKYLIVVLTGAIGTGKSTFSKIAALYTEYKLNCMEDPKRAFGLADTKGIQMLWFHVSGDKAQKDFIDSIKIIKKASPYWNKIAKEGKPHKISHTIDGVRTNNSIGSDILYYNLSELSFIPPDKAKYKLDQACKRFESRFQMAVGFSGNIVIDSSARENTSIVDDFIRNNPFSEKGLVKIVRMSIWKAKAHLNLYFREGKFDVYLGDATHKPFIIPDGYNRRELDPERIIVVPMELKPHFIRNIVGALQDQAGISTNSTGRWLQDVDKIKECFSEPLNYPETLVVDFYDLQDTLMDHLRDAILSLIPRDKICYMRWDLGIARDRAGLAIGYFDEYEVIKDEHGSDIKIPSYCLPILVQVSRKSGQETSLTHIFQFIVAFSMLRELGNVSFDQYASQQIIQDCKRKKIHVSRISVDRTAVPYDYFKRMILQNKIRGAANTLIHKELAGLRYVKGKVDHQPGGITSHKSEIPGKDIADAASGCVWDMYQNLGKASQVSNIEAADMQNQIMNQIVTESSEAQIQEMLKTIWGHGNT